MSKPGAFTVSIWTESAAEERSSAALPRLASSAMEVVRVDGDVLVANLRDFLATFKPIIDAFPEEQTGYEIDELELNLAVNATGGIELVGKLSAGAQAGIKVKLKKKRP